MPFALPVCLALLVPYQLHARPAPVQLVRELGVFVLPSPWEQQRPCGSGPDSVSSFFPALGRVRRELRFPSSHMTCLRFHLQHAVLYVLQQHSARAGNARDLRAVSRAYGSGGGGRPSLGGSRSCLLACPAEWLLAKSVVKRVSSESGGRGYKGGRWSAGPRLDIGAPPRR